MSATLDYSDAIKGKNCNPAREGILLKTDWSKREGTVRREKKTILERRGGWT